MVINIPYSGKFPKSRLGLSRLNQGIGKFFCGGSRTEFVSFPVQKLPSFFGLFSLPLFHLHRQKQKVKFHTDLSNPSVAPSFAFKNPSALAGHADNQG